MSKLALNYGNPLLRHWALKIHLELYCLAMQIFLQITTVVTYDTQVFHLQSVVIMYLVWDPLSLILEREKYLMPTLDFHKNGCMPLVVVLVVIR